MTIKSDNYLLKLVQISQSIIPRNLFGTKRYFVFCFARIAERQFFRTYLGASWIFIRVFFTFGTYAILFGVIFEGRDTRISYFDHLISGMLLWSVFIGGLSWGTRSFEILRNVRKKLFLPELTMVLAGVAAGAISIIPWTSLFLLYSFFASEISLELNLHLLFAAVLVIIFVISLTLVTSVLDAFGRDSRNFISLFSSWFLFTTPVLYEVKHVPEVLQWIVLMNPLTSILELFRHGLYGSIYGDSVFDIGIFTLILFICCFLFFTRFVVLLRNSL